MATDTFYHGVAIASVDDTPRPVATVRKSVIYITGTAPNADAATFPLNKRVMVAGSRTLAAKLDMLGTGLGSLPRAVNSILNQSGAVIIVNRVDVGTGANAAAVEKATLVNVVGRTNPVNDNYEGTLGALACRAETGFAPGILIAPGFTHQRPLTVGDNPTPTSNPTVVSYLALATRLRAVVVADGPSTNDAAAQVYRTDFDDPRLYIVEVRVLENIGGVPTPQWTSAHAAGLGAKSDNDPARGWWWSWSNQVIQGIVGTERPVDYQPGDPNSRANLLNENAIATVIHLNGYRLWGNRGAGSDPKRAFLCVQRTEDMIAESLQVAHLWAVDNAIGKHYVDAVLESVRGFLRDLVAKGGILGGSAWVDTDINTPTEVEQGHIYFDFDFTPSYPAEKVTFRAHMVNGYVVNIFPNSTNLADAA